ncbi:hypothetical protein [Aurantiacibacter spongiae]|uniref:DUF2029 domain-containing protein n=1 Tax=Aurantiacibacter spongiae TaxID=2488860 RepID=A0A3N5DAU6_9SPHN|nr:hypothetical protein [Aurantiacibacter spongiae]RPF71838.1 hypothetical protein EG799_09555 [Aurantiacibacter spongiae]
MARVRGRALYRDGGWDRFAGWPPGAALLTLVVALALLLAAALGAPGTADEPVRAPAATGTARPAADAPRDTDLRLYDRIAERVGEGENYYRVAVEEQRARDFPVRPGLAVRLPTLAVLGGLLGPAGMGTLAIVLAILTLFAWWVRVRETPLGAGYSKYVLLLLTIGAAAGFKPDYLALHEVWAGMLIALSLGLHRPEPDRAEPFSPGEPLGARWLGAVGVAALALAVRELALPYVLLMGAMALARGQRGEALAWGLLTLTFIAALLAHIAHVAQYTEPADPLSPSWFALRGFSGAVSNIVLSSPLHLLPGWIAAPLALLPLLGWLAWRSAFGLTGFLLCAGYFLAFMIAGRDNNFYWALVVMPVWFVGYAFVPRAVRSLVLTALGR